METNGRISVIIPVRNRPDVIHRAIDSVLLQTTPVHEIIVVDDCSTDETPSTIEARMRKGDPIKLVRLSNRMGAPHARNIGSDAAQGELLAFLDSDDAWSPDKIARQIELFRLHPSTPAVFTNIRRVHYNQRSDISGVSESIGFEDLKFANFLGSCSTCLTKASTFRQVGKFRVDLPSCQDWDLWIRLSLVGRLMCSQEALTIYYFDGADRISRNRTNVVRGHKLVFEQIYSLVARSEVEPLKRAHRIYLSKILCYSLGDRREAIKLASLAFFLPPNQKGRLEALRVLRDGLAGALGSFFLRITELTRRFYRYGRQRSASIYTVK